MKVLKTGKNAGCTQFYYDIGFDCGDWFNTVKSVSTISKIYETMAEVAKEYDADIEEVSVREVRTNTGKITWQKTGLKV